MTQWIFLTALSLVSALALALVYGMGGFLALSRKLDAGHRRHPGSPADPALRTADRSGDCPGRRDVGDGQLRAGVRGARPQAADHREAGRGYRARGAGHRWSSRRSTSPTPRPTRCRWPLWRRWRFSTPGAARDPGRRLVPGRPRPDRGDRRLLGGRQVDIASLAARLYDVDGGAVKLSGIDVRDLTFKSIRERWAL